MSSAAAIPRGNLTIDENPFSLYRADYEPGPEELLALFVNPTQYFNWRQLLQPFPTVLRGGRGSGKTMMLRYLSCDVRLTQWRQDRAAGLGRKGNERLSSSEPERFFSRYQPFLGVYMRIDTPSYDGFRGSAFTQQAWDLLFGHYFSVMCSLRVAAVLKMLVNEGLLHLTDGQKREIALPCLQSAYGPGYKLQNGDALEQLAQELTALKWEVEQRIRVSAAGSGGTLEGLHLSTSGQLITCLAQAVAAAVERELRAPLGKPAPFYIYLMLDEYEHFSESQQRVINTLLKGSGYPLVYKLAMRNYGWKTRQTLSEGEMLDDVQDFRELSIESTTFFGYDQRALDRYCRFLAEICRRRLERVPELAAEGWTQIVDFLPDVSVQDEATGALGDDPHPALPELHDAVKKRISGPAGSAVADRLSCGRNPLHIWLHVLLLQTRKRLDPVVLADMHEEYEAVLQGRARMSPSARRYYRYCDHYEGGLLFWHLDALQRRSQKLYCGFRTHARLSSGIVRNFLALCQESFDIAIQEGHDFGKDRAIPSIWQTVAAARLARSFRDETRWVPHHDQVSRIVDGVGNVFQLLTSRAFDERISEPDRGSFFVAVDDAADTRDIVEALETAVQRSFLYERPPRKPKNRGGNVLVRDFILSRMLAPLYLIPVTSRGRTRLNASHLRKMVTTKNLDSLRNECREIAREIGTRLSRDKGVWQERLPIV